ncbi:MAG: DNA mismatch repair protein MutL [Alishewanella sp. 34-51-39]|nr:MAG: DNA mismatch repair protein MutL [Alishewanella sp. 34-51-39]
MPIQLLPPQLANQIAAGEVVERPASVVKELVENSLDAGATQIELEIEKGGSKKILIRDNGSGIAEQELVLALSRHATSKISSLADLEQICSLGFRGEALASISSVSRLTLTSKPAAQDKAWQASAEGRDMAVQVRPAAHPDGTSIEVLDLFFNTPARRRFLRSDKTEFSHIDELVKRLALSRFDVSWSLTHNGQPIRRLPLCQHQGARQKRLAALCGRAFAEQALWIENQYQQIRLSGWILPPAACQTQAACQYSYVNGRMMRDKLLNHAIRQAYGEQLTAEQQPAFVLYLELDPGEVDVNVHPAKHEVRFHQARLVHDFVVSALADALQQSLAIAAPPSTAQTGIKPSPTSAEPVATWPAITKDNHYQRPQQADSNSPAGRSVGEGRLQFTAQNPVGKVNSSQRSSLTGGPGKEVNTSTINAQLTYLASSTAQALPQKAQGSYLLVENRYVLWSEQQQLYLQDLTLAAAMAWQQQVVTVPLLLPLRLQLITPELDWLLQQAAALEELGFDLLIRDNTAIIRAVPQWLRHTAISDWFSLMLQQGRQAQQAVTATALLALLLSANFLQAEILLSSYSQLLTSQHPTAQLLNVAAWADSLTERGHGS